MREWQPIETAYGPERVELSDGKVIWIGHLTWGADEMEWTTSDESYCDLVPRFWRPLPDLPR